MPQLPSPCTQSLCSATRGAIPMRNPGTTRKSSPCSPQLEKACMQQQRISAPEKKKTQNPKSIHLQGNHWWSSGQDSILSLLRALVKSLIDIRTKIPQAVWYAPLPHPPNSPTKDHFLLKLYTCYRFSFPGKSKGSYLIIWEEKWQVPLPSPCQCQE